MFIYNSIRNTLLLTIVLLVNYLLLPLFLRGEQLETTALIILGVSLFLGMLTCPHFLHWLIPDAVHFLLLMGAYFLNISNDPYRIGSFFGWEQPQPVAEMFILLGAMLAFQAAVFLLIRLIINLMMKIAKADAEKTEKALEEKNNEENNIL